MMGKHRGVIIAVGTVFGIIAFIITVFLFPPQLALTFGVFTAALYILVLSLIMDRNAKKYERSAHHIEGDILLSDMANYYSDRLIANGILYMTADRLIFISHEKRQACREEILLRDIKRATYGRVSKHVLGLKLFMADSSVKGFVIKDVEPFLEGLSRVLTPGLFDTENDDASSNGE